MFFCVLGPLFCSPVTVSFHFRQLLGKEGQLEINEGELDSFDWFVTTFEFLILVKKLAMFSIALLGMWMYVCRKLS